jgi:hypothetical protein
MTRNGDSLELRMQKFPEAGIGTHYDVKDECSEQHKNKMLEYQVSFFG